MVSQQPTMHIVKVAAGSDGLTSGQRAQVLDFPEHYRAIDAGNSQLVIQVPSGGANEGAAMYAVGEIRSLIADFGFAESMVAIEPYDASGTREPPIRISYLRYVAEAPACGHWPTNLADEPTNLPYPNFGCANQHNLAARSPIPPICSARARDGARQQAPRSGVRQVHQWPADGRAALPRRTGRQGSSN